MITSLLFLFAIVATPAQAEWTGAQYNASLGAELPISDRVSIQASVHQFDVPKTGASMKFAYVGPKITVTPKFWIAPKVGVMNGWMADGSDAALISIWTGAGRGSFSVFGEIDSYFSPSQPVDIYGFVSTDWNRGVVNIGIQGETVNTNLIYGPHIGATKEPFHIELQGYVSAEAETLAVRFVTAVNF